MIFREGKILSRRKINNIDVIFRLPRMRDAEDCKKYINSLIDEKARVLITKKVTLKNQKKWIEDSMDHIREGNSITVFIEIGRKVVGSGHINKMLKTKSAVDHVAQIGFSIHKKYRRMGIVQKLALFLINLAKKEWGTEIVRSSFTQDNLASKKLHDKLGFKEIGRIKKGTKFGNKYLDHILVAKHIGK